MVGGVVNVVIKQVIIEYDFIKIFVGVGMDNYGCVMLDVNYVFIDNVVLWVNVFYGYEEVFDCVLIDCECKGLVFFGFFKVNDWFDVVLDYYGLCVDDNFDFGSYLIGMGFDCKLVKNVLVYVQKEDFLSLDVDVLMVRVKFKIDLDLWIINLICVGQLDNVYVVIGVVG